MQKADTKTSTTDKSSRGAFLMRRRTAIIDIDGTISDGTHRLHHVRPDAGKERDYEAFHSLCSADTVVESVAAVVRSLAATSQVVLLTGRPENYRWQTVCWLEANNIPYDGLWMRPVGDNTPAPEYKKGVLDALQIIGHDVFLAIEDADEVVAMWRENGIHCLHTQTI